LAFAQSDVFVEGDERFGVWLTMARLDACALQRIRRGKAVLPGKATEQGGEAPEETPEEAKADEAKGGPASA